MNKRVYTLPALNGYMHIKRMCMVALLLVLLAGCRQERYHNWANDYHHGPEPAITQLSQLQTVLEAEFGGQVKTKVFDGPELMLNVEGSARILQYPDSIDYYLGRIAQLTLQVQDLTQREIQVNIYDSKDGRALVDEYSRPHYYPLEFTWLYRNASVLDYLVAKRVQLILNDAQSSVSSAYELYDEATWLHPDSEVLPLAEAYISLHEGFEADYLAHMEQVERDHLRDPLALELLSYYYRRVGKQAEMKACLRRSTVLNPDFIPHFSRLAYVELQDGKYKEAINLLDSAIAKASNSPKLYELRSAAYYALGDLGAACRDAQVLHDRFPSHTTQLELPGDCE